MITIILNEGTQRWILVVLKNIRHGFFVFVNFLYLKKTVIAFLAFTIFTFYQCNVLKLMLFLPCFLQVVNDAKFNLKLTVTNRDCNNNLQETLQQLPSKVSKKIMITSNRAPRRRICNVGSLCFGNQQF